MPPYRRRRLKKAYKNAMRKIALAQKLRRNLHLDQLMANNNPQPQVIQILPPPENDEGRKAVIESLNSMTTANRELFTKILDDIKHGANHETVSNKVKKLDPNQLKEFNNTIQQAMQWRNMIPNASNQRAPPPP